MGLIMLLLLAGAMPAMAASEKIVVYSDYKSISDTSSSGLSTYADALRAQGYTVEQMYDPITSSKLDGCDAGESRGTRPMLAYSSWDKIVIVPDGNVFDNLDVDGDGVVAFNENEDPLFEVVNNAPEKEWDNTFGGTDYDSAGSVQQTLDGGYIIAGSTESYGAGFYDFWLVKTDSTGTKMWDKTFGGTDSDYARSVQQTSDGGYIIAGDTENEAWLIKTNTYGKEQWNRTFKGRKSLVTGYLPNHATSVQQTSDGGYILAGYSNNVYINRYGWEYGDAWLIKTDINGTEKWNTTFGEKDGGMINSVQQTSDGGYVLAGNYAGNFYDAWLIKTDFDGNEQWNKIFIFGENNNEHAKSVRQTSDGGYILAGLAAKDA